jgi:hypothetical protein
LKSLFFDSLESRQDRIATATEKTFQWIWSDESLRFNEWLKANGSVYWISGKPGSGKSTLMKHIAHSQALKSRIAPPFWKGNMDPIIVAHYFNYEDPNPLARNLEGLVRSLLWQILDQNNEAFDAVLPEYNRLKQNRPTVIWRPSILTKLLQNVLSRCYSVPVCVFIDALDEYREDDEAEFHTRHARIAEYLHELTYNTAKNVRFCLSSRPYPDFQFNFITWNHLYHRISIDRLISKDIFIYVSSQFEQIVKKDGKEYLRIVNQINEKASDTFLWVKLATERLVHCWKRGEGISKLEKRLSDLPDRLSDLYSRILSEMDVEERIEVEILLGIVAAATHPLDLKELAYASSKCGAQSGFSGFESSEDMRRRIEGIGGGLLEIRFGQVRFLHSTVLDHLLEKQNSILETGNDHLRQACLYALSRISKSWPGEIQGKDSQFLKHAVLHWPVYTLRGAMSHKTDRWTGMNNSQHLIWYELFLATSWQLPSQSSTVSYQLSARRLQRLILLHNLNLAISHPTELRLASASDSLMRPNDYLEALQDVTEETASGVRLYFGIVVKENGDRTLCVFLFCQNQELDLFEAVNNQTKSNTYDGNDISADLSAIPRMHIKDDIRRVLEQPGYLGFHIANRFINEFEALESIAICASIQESVSPVQLAAYHGLLGCLEILVRNGANINSDIGSIFGTPLLAAICGIIELSTPGFEHTEPVFTGFEFLLWEGADCNQAAFGSQVGGIRTPLEVALHAISARIVALKSFGRDIVVFEDIFCSNMIYVIHNLLKSGAIPNLIAQKELAQHPQIQVLFKDNVDDILMPGARAYDDIVVRQRKQQQERKRHQQQESGSSSVGAVPTRRYSLGARNDFSYLYLDHKH